MNTRKGDSRKKPKFYWDVVYQETVEKSQGVSLSKMTKARARYVLQVSEDEKITKRTVQGAYSKLSYPLQLVNSRDRNDEGFTQVDMHEAFQHLIRFAKKPQIEKETDGEEDEQKESNTSNNTEAEVS